ncbi:unnamed protein product [Hymenolepis diminuta]|uniref:Chromodomain-helicase-DNA-binding protein 4 n=1 Tax=Hymenolepis diminuta TaxID=6216 RepID=A0A564YNJ9_HYMDI|nr:unnamed protein product [Hymenolepis diminuta]
MRRRNAEGDDSSSSAPKRRGSRNVKEKTLEQLCEEFRIEDVEITYSTDDFENWTVQKLFNQYVEPLIVEKNPNAPKDHIVQILDAKWKEFAIMNPYIPKGEEEPGPSAVVRKDLPDDEEGAGDDVELMEVDDTPPQPPPQPSTSRRASSRQQRAAAAAAASAVAATVSMSTPIPGEEEEEEEGGDVSPGSAASSSGAAAGTPASSSQQATPAPLRIKISSGKKKKKRASGRGSRRDGSRAGGGDTSDEEFERQLQEAEALQEEEQKRRRQQRMNSRRAATKAGASGGESSSIHISASAPNLVHGGGIKRSVIARVPLMGGNRQVEDGYETDHQDFCDVCQQGGEIVLCDTCPRAFHLVCLDPELDEPPKGDWSCPQCVKQGITAAAHRTIGGDADDLASTASEGPVHVTRKPDIEGEEFERDEHQEFCTVCRDGGELICCERCPASYHIQCLDPPLPKIPEDPWLCPRCGCKKPKGKVAKILFWRWKDPTVKPPEQEEAIVISEEGDKVEEREGGEKSTVVVHSQPAAASQRQAKRTREYFVKFAEMSYWACEWTTELQMDVYHNLMLRLYFKKFDMDEPPQPEDGTSYRGRARQKNSDVLNLEERFYKWGVRPEWLQPQRIIDSRTTRGKEWFLVKWRDLPYVECTWEDPTNTEVPDFEHYVDEFRLMRGLFKGEAVTSTSSKKKGKESAQSSSSSGMSAAKRSSFNANLLKKIPPEKPTTDLRKQLPKQPEYLDETGLMLHPYQLEGLNWLRFSYGNKVDTILADEMGLGKTIQTIAFLYSLYKDGHSRGPFLVAAPLSTIINWEREFQLWAPDFYVVAYVGDKESRTVIREHEFTFEEGGVRGGSRAVRMRSGAQVRFHVLLTSYEMISIDQALLSSIDWEVLVVDEAHRLKNNQSKFFRMLTTYKIAYKLLLTGTPLQNNLEELFHLLHFMSPAKFNDMQGFLDEFADISKEDQVKKLHEMLGKHLLRRLKADVLKNMPSKGEFIVRVELSPLQKKFYKFILTKNFDALSCRGGGAQPSLINVMMDLKKCCNHPYLFSAASEDAPRLPNGAFESSALRKACGKLELLSAMLKKLKAGGHRVLIFSQMTKMLDLLEDFMEGEGYKYERIDGNVTGQLRQDAIDRFNASDSTSFVFLLSTRAGGLGINLATADTVIIYDSDWNPHNDIQAFSRAHRIGQANKVMIYRFVTRATVEERVTQVAKKKMMLTHLVVRPGLGGKGGSQMSKKELDDILKFGTEDLFKHEDNDASDEHCIVYDDAALDRLLDRSQQGMEEKQMEMNDYLSSFKVAHYEKREIQDGDSDAGDEDDPNVEVIKQELDTNDPAYWEKLLRHHFEQAQEDQAKMLGKGKRHRKPVNYWTNQQEEEDDWNDNGSDHDSNFSTRDEEDDEYDDKIGADGSQIGRRLRREREGKMPPILSRVNGQIEVLGFNFRQRKAFVNSVLRFGLPPPPGASKTGLGAAWHSRDLRGKPEKVFRAYVAHFLRHLCEPDSMNQDNNPNYPDGTPRDGILHQPILTRIGIMSLVRKKVQEFEQVNGLYSMPEHAPQESATSENVPEQQTQHVEGATTDAATPISQPLSVTVGGSGVVHSGPNGNGSDDTSKASDKTEPMIIGTGEEGHLTAVKPEATVINLDESDNVEEGKLTIDESPGTVTVEPINMEAPPKAEPMEVDTTQTTLQPPRRFMFNIADGGFTDLHTIWLNEERALMENRGGVEIWNRKHDYWLLAGVCQHGYSRWQDIHNDPRFALVNEPFSIDQGKPNYLEMKNRFLARRFKLLEQALIIEEQLRRAAHQNIVCDPKDAVQSLNRRFNELECLAFAQQKVFAEALSGNRSQIQLIHRALTMMEDYLAEMKQDVTRLLTIVPRMQPVSERLNLSHAGLITKLTQQLTAAKQAKLAQQQASDATAANPDTPAESVVEEKA